MLNHLFKTRCHDLKELFAEVKTLKGFMKNLNKQALYNVDAYPEKDYLGDGFEFFIELLLKHPKYKKFDISDYNPIKSNQDTGVDGYGINKDCLRCAIQIKYKTDTNSYLNNNSDHLSNMFSTCMYEGIFHEPNKDFKYFIFTTADGLDYHTQDVMFKNMVKCYGYKDISKVIDNVDLFWKPIQEMI